MAKTNRRTYPLRKVILRECLYDYLECGHKLHTPSDIIGLYYPAKRRCQRCAKGKEQDFEIQELVHERDE